MIAPRECRAGLGLLDVPRWKAWSLFALSMIFSIKSAAAALASSVPRLLAVFTIQIMAVGESFSRLERLIRIFSSRSVSDFSFAAPAALRGGIRRFAFGHGLLAVVFQPLGEIHDRAG